MTANPTTDAPPEAAPRPAAAPYTFQQLLDRQVEKLGLDLVFHVHVPKASGGTVNALFRQNNFFALNFDMNRKDFFAVVSEEKFFENYLAPAPRPSYVLTGHFRLDHPMFRRAWMPHTIVTTLRDPIDRMLSNYNYTFRRPGNPWHDDIVNKGMSFLDYAANMYAAIGPQYSFFDHTGEGTFAPTGTATPQQCLENLVSRVGLYGLTERFEEFTVLMGYLLGRARILAVPPGNVTDQIPNLTGQAPKTLLSETEREAMTELLKDDVWFYREAVEEYERRVSDPRVQAVLADAVPLVRSCRDAVDRLQGIRDSGDRSRRAFDRV
jgi:hypothetical protein